MEFDYDNYTVLGRIDHSLNPNKTSARIKAIGLIDESNELNLFTEEESIKNFPPKGFVYAHNLLTSGKFSIGDILQFEVNENLEADGHKDNYSMERNSSKEFGFNAYKVEGFKMNSDYTDLSTIQIIGDHNNGKFYGISHKYVFGKLKINNGKIESIGKSIKVWDKDDCKAFENESSIKLLKEPDGEYLLIDCMDDNQLFEWFREHIKNIDYQLFQKLNSASNWKTKIPALFEKLPLENAEIEKIRLKRLENKISHIELTWNEIISFREQSNSLKLVFRNSIEKHIDDFQSEYSKKLKEFEDDIIKKENELNENLNKSEQEAKAKIAALNAEINKKQTEAQKAVAEYEQAKLRLIEIEKEKSRIIADFGIIKEVLSLSGATTNSTTEKCHILEEVAAEHNEMLNVKDFINNVQYYLSDFKRNPDFAKRIFETMLVYKALFIKDIRIALSVIKASGNAKYVIQHTEPDWLHFKDFWNNGLSTIWNSAHNNPEIPHFFVLEDINLSSPECYVRPLLDVIAGIRSKIPFAETNYPNNLFIFATKASSQNPTIGLKLYKETFPDWGSIAFKNDLNKINSKVFSLINGKIDTTVFSFDNLESDIEDIKNSVSSEYEKLFDEE